MARYIILLFLILPKYSTSQSRELNNNVKTIPLDDNNRKFVKVITKEYAKLIKNEVDSLLLYYPKDEERSNYAVVFWKKDHISQWIAFYQYFDPKKNVTKEILHNDTLEKATIASIYNILQDNNVRKMEPFATNDRYVYCQFYFENKKMLTLGLESKIKGKMDLVFLKAYADEQYRIVSDEIKKNKIPSK